MTNAAESLLIRTRHVKRKVKRWRGGQMMPPWVAAAVLEAVQGFRRLKGCSDTPRLSRPFVRTINALVLEAQWRTARRLSTEPSPSFNSGRDIADRLRGTLFCKPCSKLLIVGACASE